MAFFVTKGGVGTIALSAPVGVFLYGCLDEFGESLDCVGWVGVLELLVSAYEAGCGVRLHWVKCPLVEGGFLPCADVSLSAYVRYDCGGSAHESGGLFPPVGRSKILIVGNFSQRKSTRSRCVSPYFAMPISMKSPHKTVLFSLITIIVRRTQVASVLSLGR